MRTLFNCFKFALREDKKGWDVFNRYTKECMGYVTYWDEDKKVMFSATEDARFSGSQLNEITTFLRQLK
jgi:hypothetical protein